jgi:hypothetical protein
MPGLRLECPHCGKSLMEVKLTVDLGIGKPPVSQSIVPPAKKGSRGPLLKDWEKARIRDLMASGWRRKDIAKEIGRSASCVNRYANSLRGSKGT